MTDIGVLRICWTGRHVCDIIICTYYGDSIPVRSRSKHPKLEALREEGTLNPTPDEVHDPKFEQNEFFDPHDIVQVKYEMLRRVSVENASVSAATEEYGVSRPNVLPNQGQLRQRRCCWTGAAEAWSARSA